MKKLNILGVASLYKKSFWLTTIFGSACAITTIGSLYFAYQTNKESRLNIYTLNNGEVFQMSLIKDTLETRLAESQSQALTVMRLLFNLSPDTYQINQAYDRLIELSGDKSIRIFYHSLEEDEKFFSRIIAENITQKILITPKDIQSKAYGDGFWIVAKGKVVITRPSTETDYEIKAKFYLRQTWRSSANGHGFLVESFELALLSSKQTKQRFLSEIINSAQNNEK